MLAHHRETEVARAARCQHVFAPERPEPGHHCRVAQVREREAVLRRELRPPVDVDVVGRVECAAALARGDEHELLLDQQLDAQARALLRRVDHRDVEHAGGDSLDQLARKADLGAQGQLRCLAAHPQQPVEQQRVPQALLAADRQHRALAARHRDLMARTLPHLHHHRRVAHELLAGGGQRGAGLVAHEQARADRLFQRAHARADGRLRDVQPLGGAHEAAAGDDVEKGACKGDVHGRDLVRFECNILAFIWQ